MRLDEPIGSTMAGPHVLDVFRHTLLTLYVDGTIDLRWRGKVGRDFSTKTNQGELLVHDHGAVDDGEVGESASGSGSRMS
jgi:hypothetical protein